GTFVVARRVPDHPGVPGRQSGASERSQTVERDRHQGLTVLTVAAVRSCLQVQPLVEPESGQLDHGVGGDVAGQDGQMEPLVRGQRLEELGSAGASAPELSELVGGGRQLGLETLEHRWDMSGIVLLEQVQVLANDLRVRLAAHRDPPGGGLSPHGLDGTAENSATDVAALHQGPVYVEEKHPPYGHASAYRRATGQPEGTIACRSGPRR